MTTMRDILHLKLLDPVAFELPSLVPREAWLPAVPDKARAIIGRRRTGKTYFLYQQMTDLMARGVSRERLVYLNLEDERLAYLAASLNPVSRCTHCNGALEPVDKQEVADRVPARTRQHTDEYYLCRDCGKVYWRGTHWPRLQRLVQQALADDDNGA